MNANFRIGTKYRFKRKSDFYITEDTLVYEGFDRITEEYLFSFANARRMHQWLPRGVLGLVEVTYRSTK